ncbi:MAG TPA: hypothetical protein VG435_18715 [Acidimicrobiales bacterium]|jgi:hypothetical protein|nr:hypothetical protein [Acidimicrobiales bacterium]
MFKRFSAGFAVGYVLGARAGQKRYEQITDLADKVMDLPVVSRAADRAQDMVTADNGRRLLDSLRERAPFPRSEDDDDQETDEDDQETGEDESESSEGEPEDGEEGNQPTSSNGAKRRSADSRHSTRNGSGARPRSDGRSRGRNSGGRLGNLAGAALERGRVG